MDERIKFNLENSDSIESTIKKELQNRLLMLKTNDNKDDTTKLNYEDYLYNETAFLLVAVMITIIASLTKDNSYLKTSQITSIRSLKEFFFNYCIFVNLFIVINFGINVFF